MVKAAPPVEHPVNSSNADFDWDTFDSEAYFEHNYSSLRPDDAQIIEIIAGHFNGIRPRMGNGRAIDVGAGANLYPALAMLPFATNVTLYERAASNVRWLEKERLSPQESWQPFWSALSHDRDAYQGFAKPLEALASHTRVQKGDIFDLPVHQFDLGTMFFVAESITRRRREFVRATRSFVDSLLPKAPFAAAFMRESAGYTVGGRSFPAYAVDEREIERLFHEVAHGLTIEVIDSSTLRDGYCGMIVVTGRAGRTNTKRPSGKR